MTLLQHRANQHRRSEARVLRWAMVLVALVFVTGCQGVDDSAASQSGADVEVAPDPVGATQDDHLVQVQGAPDQSMAYLVPQLVDVDPRVVTVSFAVVAPMPGVTALVSTWIQDGASGTPHQQILHSLRVAAGSDPPTVPMQAICDAAGQSDLVGVELRSVTDLVQVDVEHSRFLNPAGDVCPGLAAPGAEQSAAGANEEVPVPEPSDIDDEGSASAEEVPVPEPSDIDDGAGPTAGARLVMIGVRPDDFLNVRDRPGGEIVARLREIIWQPVDWRFIIYGPDVEWEDIRRDGPEAGLLAEPAETEIVATGNTRRLLDSVWHPVWYEIEVGGVTGWASGQHLGVHGQDVDVADQVASVLGGPPSANTLQHLASVVIEALIPEYDPDTWSVTLRSGPGVVESSGDVVVDVITVRDGLSVGYQLGIAADNHGDCLATGDCQERCCDWTSDYGAPFTLRFASMRPICDPASGAASNGACLATAR